MPHVYKWAEEFKFDPSVPPAWRPNGRGEANKQKPPESCEHIVKDCRLPFSSSEHGITSRVGFSYSDLLKKVCC